MARSERQKLKLLYLRDYLLRNTDEQHPVTMKQMIAYLDQNDIPAERKSIYTDIELLRTYGMDIIQESGNYYVGSRYFELPELKLLVDSVQSSKFITYKKTGSLIKKIEEMASIYEAQLLNRQVYVTNRIKSMNESIYYNVDEIHSGIAHNRKIRFQYRSASVCFLCSWRYLYIHDVINGNSFPICQYNFALPKYYWKEPMKITISPRTSSLIFWSGNITSEPTAPQSATIFRCWRRRDLTLI
jgi:hypothetical protein